MIVKLYTSIRHKNTLVASYEPWSSGVKTVTGFTIGKPGIIVYDANPNTTVEYPGFWTAIRFISGTKNLDCWLGVGAANNPHGGGADIVFVPTATTVKFQLVSDVDHSPNDDFLYVYA